MLDGFRKVIALAFLPNRCLLAYRYDNGILGLWKMSLEYVDDYPGYKDLVIALAFL
jgi:hypothetical protein